jgi:hypothetical protein
MKYKAIIETDEIDDFEFFEDGNGKYIHGIDAGAINKMSGYHCILKNVSKSLFLTRYELR